MLIHAEQALEQRRQRILNGEAEENVPAVLPFVPDTPLGVEDASGDSSAQPGMDGKQEGVRTIDARHGDPWGDGEGEESVDVSDFVQSLSEPVADHDGIASGEKQKTVSEGPRRARRKRALSREGEMGEEMDSWRDRVPGGWEEGGMQDKYAAQIDRELHRLGGVENVPSLSSLIQQLESQDGNTL